VKIGIIGLGRMGNAIAYRLLQAGHRVMGFDAYQETLDAATAIGVTPVATITDMAAIADIIWLMLPEGAITEQIFNDIVAKMKPGSIIIDGGNSFYKDSIRRAEIAKSHQISFLDCGTSGGIRGRENGFCLMVGGDKAAYERMLSFFNAIASPGGVSLVGPTGAGHYVKMVHNGIEYALLQAYAQGFQIIKEGTFKDANLDLAEITRLWNTSSIIKSFILDLSYDIFKHDQNFDTVSGEIAENGMGSWTSQEAHGHTLSSSLIDESLRIREWSRETGGDYSTKIVALLRNQFGGHAFKTVKSK